MSGEWQLPPDPFDPTAWTGWTVRDVPLLESSRTFITNPELICTCGAPAVMSFVIHAMHECKEERQNVASLVCRECDLRMMAQCMMIADDGGETCSICGLTIDSLSAIIVNHSPLYNPIGGPLM